MKKLLSGFMVLALLTAAFGFAPARAEEETAPPDAPQDDIISVIVPTTLDFTIDPLELAGRGQIYSEPFFIENRGNSNVVLTLSDINVAFAKDDEFEAVLEPFGDEFQSERKALYLALDFGREGFPPVVLTDLEHPASVLIPLFSEESALSADGEYSSVELSFSGNVNYPPELDWLPGDVHIAMTYTLRLAPPPVSMDVTLENGDAPASGDELDEPSEQNDGQSETEPSAEPGASAEPSASPSAEPTSEPGAEPSSEPSAAPSAEPSTEPSAEPSSEPSEQTEPPTEPEANPEPPVEPSPAPVVPAPVEPAPAPVEPAPAPEVEATPAAEPPAPPAEVTPPPAPPAPPEPPAEQPFYEPPPQQDIPVAPDTPEG
ncbi:MAG: hypothetical protein LBM98_13580 [Oscillospiraceae bacterium]|jgi:hypothetical protein|nr:hypothetical protein [Oscillospiraceae bacterium]